MPRNPSLPILKCDLCSLATRNSFIFRRHRKRCIRDNGAPSQRSANQKFSAEISGDEEVFEGAEGDFEEETEEISHAGEPGESEEMSFVSEKSSSRECDILPSVTVSGLSDGKMTSRLRKRSMSDADSSSVEHTKRSSTSSSKIEADVLESQDVQQVVDSNNKGQGESISAPSGKLAPPPVSRNYHCNDCSFLTTKSRDFLLHKINVHNAHIYIFTCTFCEYASQYKHKLGRHMGQAHRVHLKNDEIIPEYAPPGTDSSDRQPTKPMVGTSKLGRPKKMDSSSSKHGRSLDTLLVKLRTKSRVTDANLSSFFTSTSSQAEEGVTGEGDLYKCKLCLFTGNSKSKVTRHLHACHINARLFRCIFCSYKTYSKIEFYAHKKKHTNKHTTMFKCAECAYATEFRPNFDRHMVQHGCDKPHKCSLCSYATDHEGALKRHVTSHHPNTEENQTLVIAGDEGTATKPGDGNEDDEDDGQEAEAEEGLDFEGFRCPICSLQYRRCPDLNRHMKSKHNMSRKEFLEHSNEDDEEIFEMDDEEFTEEMDVDEVSDTDDSEDGQPLSELCAKGKQPAAKKINKKCSYCSYIAKWPSDLRRHMRVHSVVKRFKCSLCWKKYKYLGDLNVHMRRDHEVNPDQELAPLKVSTIATKKSSPRLFRCPACPFFTKVKVDMDRHSHAHTEEKTYSCKLCKYQTYWRGDMGRHLYRKHPQEVSKDADVKQFFIFRPERRAISKGGKGLAPDNPPDSDEEDVSQQTVERAQVEGRNEDSISDTISISDSLSNCSEATVDKAGNKIYKCPLCSFSNSQAYKMKNHMDVHRNLKQFKCPECGQRSNWKYDMRKHIASRHPFCTEDVIVLSLEEAKATIQEYISNSPMKRDHNMLMGGPKSGKIFQQQDKKKAYEYRCSHCPFRSWYRNSVSKHQADNHSGQTGIGILAKPIMISLGQEPHKTSQENSAEDSKSKEEAKESSPEKLELDEEGEHLDETLTLYRCAECGKEGSSKGSIKKHYNYIHPESEVRIISVADGVEFNYYTGLPTSSTTPPPAPASDTPLTASDQGILSSKLSDPKKHGYVKPFKCSVCGQRSNWKWDIKKHLRAKHPGEFGHVIVLQLDQARATCPGRSRPSQANSPNFGSSTPEKPGISLNEGRLPVSPSMLNKSQEMMLGRYRRYKCSVCGYRSNWRTDICRHIERLHKDCNARVIFMDVDEAKKTFLDYNYFPPNANSHTPGVSRTATTGGSKFKLPLSAKTQSKLLKKSPPVTGKVWHCPKCPFMSAIKSHIVTHMQNHGMKPFHCSACGQTSRFRSPIYRHIRKQHKSTDYNAYAKIIIKFTKPSAQLLSSDRRIAAGKLVDAYLCRLCSVNTTETSTKEDMMQHILTEHGSTDTNQALKIKKMLGTDTNAETDLATSDEASKAGKAKRYFCTICPYRTDKRGMLTFHHLSHQPSSQNKYKCKFCPYYVCAPRLLHQHMKWHEEWMEDQNSLESIGWRGGGEKTPPSSPSKRGKVAFEGTPKRHVCEKCPYSTNSKNDFLYHKQFHRPKATAQYKCEHCDYWVQQRRLLKQHVKLHDENYSEESVTTSPSKSLTSDASAVLDAVEIAAIKQKMISNKITASLSTSPAVSPMKIATQCAVGNNLKKPGFILRDGVYKKLHKCSKCPYTNIRSRNVRLHELMHGWRRSDHPLMKCPYCDYYVGGKGLLSHHMKVHNQQYRPDPSDSITFDLERREQAPGMSNISAEVDDENQHVFASPDISQRQKVDALLEISRFKKFSCEKCPYASSKRSHFLRHMELHGSRQRYTCQYCDYSVPSVTLLSQHQKIHLMPNQNLLATQSFSNLQHLKEVPADVALASALPPSDLSESVTISVIHDHLDLYENDDNNSFGPPFEGTNKTPKLFRCDQCPYANVNRNYLLNHHQYHRDRSIYNCPYCNYSVPKHQFLTQHLRVHFCPLPELSDWLIENGQNERAEEVNDIDHKLAQALAVAERYQNTSSSKLTSLLLAQKKEGTTGDTGDEPSAKKLKTDEAEQNIKEDTLETTAASGAVENAADPEPQPSTSAAADAAEKAADGNTSGESNLYICQYCDREFPLSKPLIAHELQHLIGNHFEFVDELSGKSEPTTETGSTTQTTEGEEDNQYVTETTTAAATTEIIGTIVDEIKEEEMDIDQQKAAEDLTHSVGDQPANEESKEDCIEEESVNRDEEPNAEKETEKQEKIAEENIDNIDDKDESKESNECFSKQQQIETYASPGGSDSVAGDKPDEQSVV